MDTLKKAESYFKPVTNQLQWCISLLNLISVFFLLWGKPTWMPVFYVGYGFLTVTWIVYYFKRGRKLELQNIAWDSPGYLEILELRKDFKKLKELLEAEKRKGD